MAFVQKYEKGKNLIKELKDSSKEYVVEDVNTTNNTTETQEISPSESTTVDKPTSINKPIVNTGDKITINGIDINKKLLINDLKKKSFSATGLNRVV